MKSHLFVTASPESGMPLACIAAEHVWDVVEYLSFQRVRVSYSYDLEHFIVCFHQCDVAAAQALLDDWARTGIPHDLVEA